MCNVWKIGSRWGKYGPSVLNLFMEYGCVFFGDSHKGPIGNWHKVAKGDLFIVSDGYMPIAIGESLGVFKNYDEAGLLFRATDCDALSIYDCDVQICPARLIMLLPKERKLAWGINGYLRFCATNDETAKMVRQYWERSVASQGVGDFDIKARVVPLADIDDKESVFQKNFHYHIPIYQRPYSWTETELRKLMEDLRQGLNNNDPVFMGTMQLSQPIVISKDGEVRSYDVIDGQQRLTTFLILLSVLEKNLGKHEWLSLFESAIRTSVNKQAAQNDLDALFCFLKERPLEGPLNDVEALNPYLRNAKIVWDLIKEMASSENDDEHKAARECEILDFSKRLLAFIENELKIVIIETHAGLSKTLKIFNTINTSGLDLGSEDLFKVRFFEYLKKYQHGGDDAFEEISKVYEKIVEYNKAPYANTYLSMESVLSAYQRIIIGRSNLHVETFSMSHENFFEQLFDTVLCVHEWPSFKKFSLELKIEDLHRVCDCYIQYLRICDSNPKLRIFRHFLWETRYGYAANFPVIALYCGVVDEQNLEQFVEGLFKSLTPASLYFQKTVSRGRSQLVELLKAIGSGDFKYGDSVVVWSFEKWFDGSMSRMIREGLGYEIAWVVKWKNLLCKLVEYIQTPEEMRDNKLFDRLFLQGFDIEHIQSYKDEKDSVKVLKDWEGEINKIGNLAMFESSLNRGVQNHSGKKPEAYAKSVYKSLSCLSDKVSFWTKDDAVKRREIVTDSILEYLQQSV